MPTRCVINLAVFCGSKREWLAEAELLYMLLFERTEGTLGRVADPATSPLRRARPP